jgi:hypothetical protein
MFCRQLFVIVAFFFWPLYCLPFFVLRFRSLIGPLVSSNLSWDNDLHCITWLQVCFHYVPEQHSFLSNRIGDAMVSVFASSAVDRGLEYRCGQTKDNKIGICCFSAKHAALRRKRQDWLARNQDNVSESGDRSIRGLLFQWTSTIQIQLSVLVWYKAGIVIVTCSRCDIAEKGPI